MVNEARAPTDEKIRQQVLDKYRSGIKPKELSEKTGISINTIKSWIKRDKAKNNEVVPDAPKKKAGASSKRPRGAPPGNKNAEGSGAPEGNKNAVKTGEFETLFFDTLEEDEKKLIAMIQLDKERLLLQEIQLLTVRERRMLNRIQDIRQSADMQTDTGAKGMTAIKYQSGIEKDKQTKLTEFTGVLGQIQAIEDALTRVQARKQRAIESLHRFGFDDARLELELMKVELAALKHDTQGEEQGDDGFMDALKTEASSVWVGG